jgi:hypothetical protein
MEPEMTVNAESRLGTVRFEIRNTLRNTIDGPIASIHYVWQCVLAQTWWRAHLFQLVCKKLARSAHESADLCFDDPAMKPTFGIADIAVSFDRLLASDLDAIVIATPIELHTNQAIAALGLERSREFDGEVETINDVARAYDAMK